MNKFTVYIESAYGVKYPIYQAESFAEAFDYCSEKGWCYKDNNGYLWDLDFTE